MIKFAVVWLVVLWIALLALWVSDARADSFFVSPNQSGGRIVLTTQPCATPPSPRLMQMWTETPTGRLIMGCWSLFNDRVQVLYEDGTRYAYEPAGFVKVENQKGAM